MSPSLKGDRPQVIPMRKLQRRRRKGISFAFAQLKPKRLNLLSTSYVAGSTTALRKKPQYLFIHAAESFGPIIENHQRLTSKLPQR